VTAGRTPSQTVGPFFSIGMSWDAGPFVVPEGTEGSVWIRGTMTDGDGEPVPDGVVEIWQRDPEGRVASGAGAAFRGFGRASTDADGRFGFCTVKPGAVDGAPHVDVAVFARGLLNHLFTRIYFGDEEAANAADPVLAAIDDEAARRTLVAPATPEGFRFDIRLQGEHETVFFSI